MSDYIKDLERIERDISAKKIEKVRLEERKANAEAQLKQLEADINEMVPAGVPAMKFIADEEAAIKKGIAECREILDQTSAT